MARASLLHLVRSQTSRSLKSTSQNFLPAHHQWRSGTWLHSPVVKTNPKSTNWLSVAQKRWTSQSANPQDDSKISINGAQKGEKSVDDDKGTEVFYYNGPLSSTIKEVHRLCASFLCASVSLWSTIAFMTPTGSTIICLSASTTAMAATVFLLRGYAKPSVHLFMRTYVHRLRWQPGSDSFDVEMLSWLTTPVHQTIKFSDIRPLETHRPFVTFKANGKFYFVDEDHCQNKALLARLTP